MIVQPHMTAINDKGEHLCSATYIPVELSRLGEYVEEFTKQAKKAHPNLARVVVDLAI